MIGYFDGASRSNPGDAGFGCCLVDGDGHVVWEMCGYMGIATNNEAEYSGAIALLEEIERRGERGITIRGDSKLVVSQVRGEWKVKAANLVSFHARARELASRVGASFEWVPRERNKIADALSNRAIDERVARF